MSWRWRRSPDAERDGVPGPPPGAPPFPTTDSSMAALQVFKRGLEFALAVFSVFLITVLFLLVTVAVAYRELGAALTWYDEVATILLAWLTYFGSAYAARPRSFALRRLHSGCRCSSSAKCW
jgi:cytochrome c biogenesis protein CcdA